MLDQVFVDKSTGEEVRIVNEDVNFYVLDDSSIYYIYNYFDTIRYIRLKKLERFNNQY